MRIETLRAHVTDEDLQGLITTYKPDESPVSDLAARFAEQGVIVSGKAKAGPMKVPFEATLAPSVAGNEVRLELADLKALGPVGNMLKGTLMSILSRRLPEIPGLQVDKKTITCDVVAMLADRGLGVEVETLRIQPRPGEMSLELAGLVRSLPAN